MDSNFVTLLRTLQSVDNAARAAAEKSYTDARTAEPGQVIASLAACLSLRACPEEALRTQAATLLRRAVMQLGPDSSAWTVAGPAVRSQVKVALLQALETEPSSNATKMLVASIAAVASETESLEEPWPELVPGTFSLATSRHVSQREAALRLLAELMGTACGQTILGRRQELGALLQEALGESSLQLAALGLVTEMVSVLDSASCQALQPVLPTVEATLKAMAASSNATAFEEALQALVACALGQGSFFKSRYKEWLDIMLAFAAAKGAIEDGCRSLSFEWVSTIAETKSKALVKAVPDLPRRVLSTAFAFLAEVQEDEAWPNVDEDEGEDDDDGLHKAGEAKVDFFVRKLGFGQTKESLLSLLEQHGTCPRWEGRFAAAMAARAAVEYVDDSSALDAITKLLVQLAQDGHMRVRYAALLALGQTCHDQEADFHSRWHTHLIPLLAKSCGDPVDRCAAMAAGALEAVIGDLEETILAQYAQTIVEALVKKLMSSQHKGVLVAVMEALGALAAGLEGCFDGYYDQLMAMLLAFVSKQDTLASTAQLRGKAFECISLLGYAVGKEKFAPAAQQTMTAMLATPQVADDFQTDCIRESMERICKVLGHDFSVFLPALVPGILASMRVELAVTTVSGDAEEDADDELTIPTEDGLMKVKTAQMQEILSIVCLLGVFVKETGSGFLEYVRPTAEALGRILSCADPVLNIASNIRDAVYPCWAELVEVVSKAAATRGQEAQALAVELVERFVSKVADDLAKAEDPEDIAPMAYGIASVIRSAGAGCLQAEGCKGVCDLAVSEILKSLQREKALEDANAALQQQTNGEECQDEDDDDGSACGDVLGKGEEEEEQECRQGLSSIFGACMQANPEAFVAHSWPALQALMQEWLGPKGSNATRLVGLKLASEICDSLGEKAVAIWPVFMEVVLASVCACDAVMRSTAAATVMLAAQVPAFGPQYGAQTYVAVGQCLQKFKAKKSDEAGLRAVDNVVAALVQLCLSHPTVSPDLDTCWQACLSRLPLKVQLEEGRKLHRRLLVEVQQPGGGNLGNVARAAQLLGYLCEIYGRSEHCDEQLKKDLATALASLPQQAVGPLFAQFSAKQQKKAERVLQDGRAGV